MRTALLALVTLPIGLSASPASAINGHYKGAGSEPGGYRWQLDAKVTSATGGRHRVVLQSTNANCASQTEGIGRLRGKMLDVHGDCRLTITLTGRSMAVKEHPGCAYHGALCTFDGTLTKVSR